MRAGVQGGEERVNNPPAHPSSRPSPPVLSNLVLSLFYGILLIDRKCNAGPTLHKRSKCFPRSNLHGDNQAEKKVSTEGSNEVCETWSSEGLQRCDSWVGILVVYRFTCPDAGMVMKGRESSENEKKRKDESYRLRNSLAKNPTSIRLVKKISKCTYELVAKNPKRSIQTSKQKRKIQKNPYIKKSKNKKQIRKIFNKQ